MFRFTVNYNLVDRLHREKHNVGVSMATSFGALRADSELTMWPNDSKGELQKLRKKHQ